MLLVLEHNMNFIFIISDSILQRFLNMILFKEIENITYD